VTLGQRLQEKRNELGKSLAQISSATKIHVKILTCLEKDEYRELPAKTFTRGFIVSYCKALGLDPEKTLLEHQDFLEQKFAERKDKDLGHQGYVFEGKELEQNKRWMIFGVSAAAIFAIAVLLIFKPQNHKRKELHKEFTEEVADGTDEPANPNGPTAVGSPGAEVPAGANGASPNTAISAAATSPTISPTATASASARPSINALVSSSTTSSSPSPATSPVAVAATETPVPDEEESEDEIVPAKAKPSATPLSSPAIALDKLNKGDDLSTSDVKKKIILQALDDVWVRYQVDEKPAMLLILRKGKYLVIKAKEKIVFDSKHHESLRYKTKGSYHDLDHEKFTVGSDGKISASDTGVVGGNNIPEQIPASPSR
jgi:cytoskeleton protein RodZ